MKNELLGQRYRILDRIGEGGMAFVYLALDEKLGRKVAIKVLHEHMEKNADIRKRFQMEAQAVSSLEHPNIVKVYDFSGDASERLWIVTEVIRGKNLAQFVQKYTGGTLHPIVAVCMVRETSKALEKAHGHGIVHRDIKPENIMVTTEGRIKLMDFGIAKDLGKSNMTMTGTFMGSPSYMSPEQIRGRDVDLRSDIYSLSVLFYEIVTGRLPFPGQTTHEVVMKIMEGEFAHPRYLIPTLPDPLNMLIVRGMAKDPSLRPQSARQFGADLDRFLATMGFDESHIELERYFKDRPAYEERLAKAKTALQQASLMAMRTRNQVSTAKGPRDADIPELDISAPRIILKTPEPMPPPLRPHHASQPQQNTKPSPYTGRPGSNTSGFAPVASSPRLPAHQSQHQLPAPQHQVPQAPSYNLPAVQHPHLRTSPPPASALPPPPGRPRAPTYAGGGEEHRQSMQRLPRGNPAPRVRNPGLARPPRAHMRFSTTRMTFGSLVGGILLVAAVAVISFAGFWELQKRMQIIPHDLLGESRPKPPRGPRKKKDKDTAGRTSSQKPPRDTAPVVAAVKPDKPDKPDKADKPDKPDRPDRTEKLEKVDRSEKIEKADKPRRTVQVPKRRQPSVRPSVPTVPTPLVPKTPVTGTAPVPPRKPQPAPADPKDNGLVELAAAPTGDDAADKTTDANAADKGTDKGATKAGPADKPADTASDPASDNATKTPAKDPAKAGKASVLVSSQPAAEVYLDGRRLGTTIDKTGDSGWLSVKSGKHVLELRRQGYGTHRIPLDLEPGEQRSLPRVDLVPTSGEKVVEKTSALTLRVNLLPAQVTVRNLDTSATQTFAMHSSSKVIRLENGRYQIRVDHDGEIKERELVLTGAQGQLTFVAEFTEAE